MGFLKWMAGCRAEKPMPKLFASGLPEPKAWPPMPPVRQPLKPHLMMRGGDWYCIGGSTAVSGATPESVYECWRRVRGSPMSFRGRVSAQQEQALREYFQETFTR